MHLTSMLRAYLIDDEELALKRLSRMLAATGRVEVTGLSTDPVEALNFHRWGGAVPRYRDARHERIRIPSSA